MMIPMHTLLRKIAFKLRGEMYTLHPKVPIRGRVLLSYTTFPFIYPEALDGHTNRWECIEIAEIFRRQGYIVDIIDFDNTAFIPRKKYDICIDIQNNLERFSPHLGQHCVKVFHIPAAHWLFQNIAEYTRLCGIKEKKGVILFPKRIVPASKNIEYADIASILGNDFTVSTYAYAKKPLQKIPISTTHTFPDPSSKDFEAIRNNYIWLGGSGMAHKGLDLVLEAFAAMPERQLVIFGKKDEDFAEAYKKELFETANICYAGNVDIGSDTFTSVATRSLGIIFPSASEGSSGGVVTAMHAGLIPIISFESGVDINDFGIILKENTPEEIIKSVTFISSLSAADLERRAFQTWEFARAKHTRENFSKEYATFALTLIKNLQR
jgi:glycosyltransferase involved in cell wall biosynthesis